MTTFEDPRACIRSALRIATIVLCLVPACHGGTTQELPDAAISADASLDGATGCAPGLAGAACVLGLYDQAASCDAIAVAKLRTELDARNGLGPLWFAGRALFRTQAPQHVAGGWNNWDVNAFATARFCGTDLVIGVTAVPTGFWPYKLVAQGTWSLDPANPAFAYDDFSGNADHRNSVLDTPDSGRGHLVHLDQACSTALGNCRNVTAYLPAGYDAGNQRYPVLFMHDGKNVWDDHTCCFGHTGWEINVTLDTEIAAGRVSPIVVIAADQTPSRNDEYGLTPATTDKFIAFQLNELQPHALAQVRGDGKPVYIAGSSLGGLVSMQLALRHPNAYAGVASLSGAFWPNNNALAGEIPLLGKQALAIYIDHGGQPADNSDGAQDSIDVRDRIVTLGWHRSDSPGCTLGQDVICYHWEPNATHDELAWKARAWRFLRFLFPH